MNSLLGLLTCATESLTYSRTILWRERNRFGPAVLAVAFSTTLIALQCGLLLGLLAVASRPIDRAVADLWVGSPHMPTLGYSEAVPEAWRARLAVRPEVERTEPYLIGFTSWSRPTGGKEICYVMGSRLGEEALGWLRDLTPDMRARLAEPGTVVVDEASRDYLGLTAGVGETAEIAGRHVRVVALLRGVRTIGMMPGVFCSLRTARLLLPELADRPDHATYLLVHCRRPEEADGLAKRLRREEPEMDVLTSGEFSRRTRWHWLTKTKAGIHLGFCALLGLVVGAVVTSQTLHAATAASLREYAVLRALGTPRWRVAALVLAQSFWIGLVGNAVGLLVIFALSRLVAVLGLDLLLSPWLLASTAGVTLVMALFSGLAASRSVRLAEPITLLR